MVFFLPVLHIRHECSLSDIRHDDVSSAAEFRVFLRIFHVKGRIKLPIVSHYRVNENQSVISAEAGKKLFHLIYLLDSPEVAGINSIKLHVFTQPVFTYRLDLIRKILHCKIFEHGMCRQNSCRQNDCFRPESRDDRQSDRDRTLAQT